MSQETTNSAQARTISAWDPVVRITHWGIALIVVLNGLMTEGGSAFHIWIGYGALTLLILRLAWGLIGTEEARFSAFPISPSGVKAHLAEIRAGETTLHPSHNPLGALMVYALWTVLAVVVTTGVLMAGGPPFPQAITEAQASDAYERMHEGEEHDGAYDDRYEGPYGSTHERADEDEAASDGYGDDASGEDTEENEALEEIHEAAANLLLLLAAIHVGGVAFETRRGGTSLLRRMISGRK